MHINEVFNGIVGCWITHELMQNANKQIYTNAYITYYWQFVHFYAEVFQLSLKWQRKFSLWFIIDSWIKNFTDMVLTELYSQLLYIMCFYSTHYSYISCLHNTYILFSHLDHISTVIKANNLIDSEIRRR